MSDGERRWSGCMMEGKRRLHDPGFGDSLVIELRDAVYA